LKAIRFMILVDSTKNHPDLEQHGFK